MPGTRRNARILAVQALYAWDLSGTLQEDFSWSGQDIPGDTRDFARLLLNGTIENREMIDKALEQSLQHWEIDRLARVDLAVLRLGIYSLMFQKDIPPQVSIDEAIEIAKQFCNDESYRFVNGVLDSVRKNMAGS